MHFMSQVFLAMESLGKDDHELDFSHHSEALLPFFQALYFGNTLALTDTNVLDVLKLAHMYDTTWLDAACTTYLQSACTRLEAVMVPERMNCQSSPSQSSSRATEACKSFTRSMVMRSSDS
jgi:hypothetical protein